MPAYDLIIAAVDSAGSAAQQGWGVKDTVTVVGGLLGALAFIWKVWDAFAAYVHIDIEVGEGELERGPTVLLTVENKGSTKKKIHYAAVVVGPEGESLTTILQRMNLPVIARVKASGNPFMQLYFMRRPTPVYVDSQYALIPIPFFYAEQDYIGDEKLKMRSLLEVHQFRQGIPLTLRFIVYMDYPFRYLRWRTTADLLFIPLVRSSPQPVAPGG